jgi:hydrogenase maturation protease
MCSETNMLGSRFLLPSKVLSRPEPLIIAYGNPLRGDDGAGPYAASLLSRDDAAESWQIVICQQLTPEMAEAIAGASVVVFVDADSDLKPGEVAVRFLDPASEGVHPIMHQLDAASLLGWARTLFGRAPAAWVVGIGAESFELRESLTPAVGEGARKAAQAIRELLGPATSV